MRITNEAFVRACLVPGLLLVAGGACAVSTPLPASARCHVEGAEQLPEESGGAESLCAAVQRALAKAAPRQEYRAELRVLRRDMIEGVLVARDGTRTPPLQFTISDASFSTSAFDHFASDLATLATQLSSK